MCSPISNSSDSCSSSSSNYQWSKDKGFSCSSQSLEESSSDSNSDDESSISSKDNLGEMVSEIENLFDRNITANTKLPKRTRKKPIIFDDRLETIKKAPIAQNLKVTQIAQDESFDASSCCSIESDEYLDEELSSSSSQKSEKQEKKRSLDDIQEENKPFKKRKKFCKHPSSEKLESSPTIKEILKFPSGSFYIGETLNGKAHGYGKFYENEQLRFMGRFVDGKVDRMNKPLN